ncbi:hypothetical protein JAAARDRAFT_60459 [Jaapia argillacea MUCL 33604]|uniref:NAD(P)-binding protein n=1 Tax=Jaapia argillacea MUCL 33604 TaxID=933084 RepID=A0A067PT59_9AGAM|nr:hypothetical protein JAAARDRAFT_60459 [Jaapia argillacea MUCL 33604]
MDTVNPATLLSKRFRPNEIPDLTSRVAIVTGGSAGIGYYDAIELAKKNAKVIIISATLERGKQAESEMNNHITSEGGKGSVEWIGLDLGDLKATDEVAKRLAKDLARLDILILNAGIGQGTPGFTKDGLGNHYGVNNLAHYVLSLRLLSLMEKTATSGLAQPTTVRIVFQTSELHRMAPSDVQFASKEEVSGPDRDPVVLYGRSKLGMILNGRALATRKLNRSAGKIVVISVHPGTVDTDLQEAWSRSYGWLGKLINPISRKVGKSALEGAEASLWAATSDEINESNWQDYQGNYYSEAKGKAGTESNPAKDMKLADNYWSLCARLSKEILGEELN